MSSVTPSKLSGYTSACTPRLPKNAKTFVTVQVSSHMQAFKKIYRKFLYSVWKMCIFINFLTTSVKLRLNGLTTNVITSKVVDYPIYSPIYDIRRHNLANNGFIKLAFYFYPIVGYLPICVFTSL